MKIGYGGYASGNNGIADRRRIIFWAEKRGHTLVQADNSEADIVVITSSSDANYWAQKHLNKPLILDVVDGLIGEQSLAKDYFRGIAKWATRENTPHLPRRYSQSLLSVARKCQRVICSSPEQVAEWKKFGISAIDILDFHEEIPKVSRTLDNALYQDFSLFWEGLPATLGSMELLENVFKDNETTKYTLNILTNTDSYKYMNKYVKVNLKNLINKQLELDNLHVQIEQWNIQNLTRFAQNSSLGVLPISANKGYNHLKAENRLLIMWRLGLPVLASPLDSYIRVMREADIPGICEDKSEWSRKSKLLSNSLQLQQEFIEKAQNYLSKRHTVEDLLEKWDAALSF